jgi:hypothetical protein
MPGPKILITALIGLLLVGCARTYAPKGYLTVPESEANQVYGAWLEVYTTSAAQPDDSLSGEFIAVSPQVIYTMNPKLNIIHRDQIIKARAIAYDSESGAIGTQVFLGTLATITNGFFLVFTAPMWLIGGSFATANRSWEPIEEYPQKNWEELRQYARFPAGIPEGINLPEMKPNPFFTKTDADTL